MEGDAGCDSVYNANKKRTYFFRFFQMNESEIDEYPNDVVPSQSSDEGLTFHWFKLIIGAAICYFWLFESWELLLALAIVIIIHELGHVVVGKSFGCIIEEMQVFLLTFVSYKPKQKADGKSWRNIKWSLGTLPLGGFTKFKSRQNDAIEYVVDKDRVTVLSYFDDKPAWQRLIIIAGGILFNFATFLLIYITLPYLPSSWLDICEAIMFLSLIVAVLNFLPVYPLDGGAIIFSLYEMVIGKKPSQKFVNICAVIGFIIIVVFFWVFPQLLNPLIDFIINIFF